MSPLSTPPTDPSQIVIVIQRDSDGTVLAATFKYKKGKWCGCLSGDKFTTEQLVPPDAIETAGWIPSPLQPDYASASSPSK